MLWIALASVVLLQGDNAHLEQKDERSFLRTVANQFEANRLGFNRALFEFTFVQGGADAVGAVVAGRMKRPIHARGAYAILDELQRYELIEDILEQINDLKQVSREQRSLTFISFRYLWNDKVSIYDWMFPNPRTGGWDHRPQAYADPKAFITHCHVPLRLGRAQERGTLSFWIDKALKGEDGLTVSEVADVVEHDTRLLHIVLTSPKWRESFWVDLERGALPIRSEESVTVDSREYSSTTERRDVRRTPQGWIPFSVAWHVSPDIGYRLDVTRAVYGESMDRDAFALSFPEPQTVVDALRLRTFGKKQEWTLADVGGSGQPFPQPVRVISPRGPSMPRERRALNWALVAAVVVTVAAAVGAWFVRRKARRKM